MPLPPTTNTRMRWIDAHAHIVPNRVIEALQRSPNLYGVDVEDSNGHFKFTFGQRRIDQSTSCELVRRSTLCRATTVPRQPRSMR